MQLPSLFLGCIPSHSRLWRFFLAVSLSIFAISTTRVAQAASGISDVYLWYYDLTPSDLDEDLAGDGYNILTRYRYGFAPDEPLTNLGFGIDKATSDDLTLYWNGIAGINYQVFSTSNLLGSAEEWVPCTDILTSTYSMQFQIPVDKGTYSARFYRLAIQNPPASSDQIFSVFEQTLLANADPTWDRDENGLSDKWEWLNFGQMGIDPTGDPDGDGATNRDEQLGNSNPNDFYSQPQGNLEIFLILVGGNEQSGVPYSYLPEMLAVRVTDTNSQPIANAPVTFARLQGNGHLEITPYSGLEKTSIVTRTDAGGIAQVYYRLGPTLATQNVIRVSAGSATPVNFDVSTYTTAGLTVAPVTSTLQVLRGGTTSQQLTLGNNTTSPVNWAIRYHGDLVTTQVLSGHLATPPYSWIASDMPHGPAHVWNDIAATGTRLTALDDADDNNAAVTLPFTFPFYDETFSQIFVSSNGYVTFGSGHSSYTPHALPSSSSPARLVAGVRRDLKIREGGAIYYQRKENSFIIQYDDVPAYSGPARYTFQIVLVSNGTIYLHYNAVGDASGVVTGVQNQDCTSGLNINGGNFSIAGGKTIKIVREPCPYPWLSVNTPTGIVDAGANADISLAIAPGNDVPTGNYLGQLEFYDINGVAASAWVDVTLQILSTPTAEDSDGDGLPDAWELAWLGTLDWFGKDDPDGDGVSNAEELHLNLRPDLADTDGDGLSDSEELVFGTNPLLADTDGDGLLDGDEIRLGANPFVPDTDGDGIPDGWEFTHGANPANKGDALADPDGDGVPNLWEYLQDTDPSDPASRPPANWIVDPAQAGTGNYVATIQQAINNVPSGTLGIVEVAPGIYNECVSIPENRRIALIARPGTDANRTPVEIRGPANNGNSVLSIYSSSVVSGFRITRESADRSDPYNVERAVYIHANDAFRHARLVNCLIAGHRANSGAGIYVEYGDITLLHCTLVDNLSRNYSKAIHLSRDGLTLRLYNTIIWDEPVPSLPNANPLIYKPGNSTVITAGSILKGGGYGSLDINPLLTPRNWLRTDSPARAAAVSNGADTIIRVDIHGETRKAAPQQADIGADEFVDSNNDGLPDIAGIQNPVTSQTDTDNDGLTDIDEYNLYGTDPQNPDIDGDGLVDGLEIQAGSDPYVADTDGDGIPDGWEFTHGANPVNRGDALADPDGDGIPNLWEYLQNTDPSDPASRPPANWIVDPSQAGTANYVATIQRAIDNVPYNTFGIIEVVPGIYNECVTIHSDRRIALIAQPGTGLERTPVEIRGPANNGSSVLSINNSSVVSGFRITRQSVYRADPYNVERAVYISNYDTLGHVRLVNCIISGHRAGYGAGIYMDHGDITLLHCTLLDNLSRYDSRAIYLNSNGQTLRLYNTIVWDEPIPSLPTTNPLIYKPSNATIITSGSILKGGEFGSSGDDPLLNPHGYLRADSPARSAAIVTSADTTARLDIHGELRKAAPQQADIGADEFVDSNNDDLPDIAGIQGIVTSQTDTDNDGLTDLDEYNLHGTNLQNADTDGDGLADGLEIQAGANPLIADTDGDGIPDGWEVTHGANPTYRGDALADADGDGVPNRWEYQFNTDPADPDSRPPANWIVDPAQAGTGNYVATIQQAINNCPYNTLSIVEVAPGIYNECVTIHSDRRVALIARQGTGLDRTPVEIRGPASNKGNSVLTIASPSVVSGFRITREATHRTDIYDVEKGVYVSIDRNNGLGQSRLINCVISGHRSGQGAGIYMNSGDLALLHCTLFDNLSRNYSRAIHISNNEQTLRLYNTIVWDEPIPSLPNTNPLIYKPTNATVITSGTILKGGEYGASGADPLFNPRGYLRADSPALNAAITTSIDNTARIDIHGEGRKTTPQQADIGADEFVDSNNDGLPDIVGIQNTVTGQTDTDNDGVSDLDEYNLHGTDPLNTDTDGDGFADGLEVQAGTNPLSTDTDLDGMPDGWEADHGTNPLLRDAMEDPDGDGYPNIFEYKFDSHPNNPVSRPIANYFVNASGPGPHHSIGAALDAARNGGTEYAIIEVAPGIYRGDANHNLAVGYSNRRVLIISTDGPASTVVDGHRIPSDDDYDYDSSPASQFAEVYSGSAIVGLTISSFRGDTVIYAHDDYGIPTRLQNLRLQNLGQGVNGTHISLYGRDARVSDIQFRDSRGRLIWNEAANAEFRNIDARNCYGEVALEIYGTKVLMEDINLVDWTSTRWGAIYPRASQTIWRRGLVKNVTVPANYDLAVIEADYSDRQLTMENVMVSHNTGAGIAALRGPATLTSCTFWGNTNTHASRPAIHSHGYSQRIQLDHTIVWDNSPAGEIATGALTSARYTWSSQTLSGVNNSTQNPGLAHGGRLAWDSPVRDAGDLDILTASTAGIDYEGEPIGTDVAIGADQWIDEDENNLPDAWEIDWFGELGGESGDERFDNDDDEDGLTNSEEFFLGTNPLSADTDGDGMTDGWEVEYGLDPLSAADSILDQDGDGVPNLWEYVHDTDPANPASRPSADWIVNPAQAGTGNIVATIQDAINNVTSDTPAIIEVVADIYAECITIPSNRRIALIGQPGTGATRTPPEIRGPANNGNPVVSIYSSSVVSGFRITREPIPRPDPYNAKQAVYVRADNISGKGHVRMVNCIINGHRSDYGAGVFVENGDLALLHCTLFDNLSRKNSKAIHLNSDGLTLRLLNTIVWDTPNPSLPNDNPLIYKPANSTVVTSGTILKNGGYGSSNADPRLTPRGYLRSNSPARNAAVASDAATFVDINGEARKSPPPPSQQADIGADEYVDSNNDGLPDIAGVQGAVTSQTDTDNDGISDLDEYNLHGTDPLLSDTDGDGLADGAEIQAGTNPLLTDTDGDGLPDGWEVAHGTDPLNRVDALLDNDGDGVPNLWEYLHNTDPADPASRPSADWIVNPAQAGTGNIVATIQEAIDNVSPGAVGIIEVVPGIYRESSGAGIKIPADRRIALLARGQGANPASHAPVEIRGPADNGNAVLSIHSSSVVSGFRITREISRREDPYTDLRAVYLSTSDPIGHARLVNCIIHGHRADYGAAVFVENGNLTLLHCTLFDNFSRRFSNAIHLARSGQTLKLLNTIVWNQSIDAPVNNNPLVHKPANSTVVTSGTILKGGGYGSMDVDPLLNPLGYLRSDSPARSAAVMDAESSTTRIDIHGEPRKLPPPPSRQADIGADEFIDSNDDGLPDFIGIQIAVTDETDTDDDGLTDLDEYNIYGTDPLNPDTDGDGLSDGQEIALGTNPLLADTDGDGLNDYLEVVVYNTDPLDPDSGSALADLNHDGIADGPGAAHGIDPTNMDHDGDGISNEDELRLGTDPFNADTDGDGVPDNLDVYPTDPTRWALPPGDPNDTTPPVITLTAPSNAVLISTTP